MDKQDRYQCLLSYVRGAYDLAKLHDFPKGPDRDPEKVLMSDLLGFDVDIIIKHPKVVEISKLIDFKQWGINQWHITDAFFELTYKVATEYDTIDITCTKINQMAEKFFEFERNLERQQESVSSSLDTLLLVISNDPSYYYSWQANIAMQIQDTFRNAGYELPELHKLANESAKNFLDMLINQREVK